MLEEKAQNLIGDVSSLMFPIGTRIGRVRMR